MINNGTKLFSSGPSADIYVDNAKKFIIADNTETSTYNTETSTYNDETSTFAGGVKYICLIS